MRPRTMNEIVSMMVSTSPVMAPHRRQPDCCLISRAPDEQHEAIDPTTMAVMELGLVTPPRIPRTMHQMPTHRTAPAGSLLSPHMRVGTGVRRACTRERLPVRDGSRETNAELHPHGRHVLKATATETGRAGFGRKRGHGGDAERHSPCLCALDFSFTSLISERTPRPRERLPQPRTPP